VVYLSVLNFTPSIDDQVDLPQPGCELGPVTMLVNLIHLAVLINQVISLHYNNKIVCLCFMFL